MLTAHVIANVKILTTQTQSVKKCLSRCCCRRPLWNSSLRTGHNNLWQNWCCLLLQPQAVHIDVPHCVTPCHPKLMKLWRLSRFAGPGFAQGHVVQVARGLPHVEGVLQSGYELV